MGQRAPEVADEPIVEPGAGSTGQSFPLALLGALVGAVLLAVGLSVFIVMRIIGPEVKDRQVRLEEMEELGSSVAEVINRIYNFPLDPIVVNLAGSNAERYLKATVVLGYELPLEAGDDQLEKELQRRRPEIRSQIIAILQTKRLEDVDSPEGREIIRRELLNRINAMLVSGRVTNAYYTEFVVQ